MSAQSPQTAPLPLPHLLLLVFVVILNSQTTDGALDTSVCTPDPSNTPGANDPPLPVLPERFTIRVEANLLNKNSTIDVHEWHDGPGNRGAASTWLSSVQLSYLYSYTTNEQFSFEQVAGGSYECQVTPLDKLAEPYLHGADRTAVRNSSYSHIYSSAQALSFGGLPEHYEGRSTVRGIPTDAWSSCVYWPHRNATMRVVWHFTVRAGWDTALGVPQTPVRCQVTGKVDSPGAAARPFSHLYEVTQFYTYLDGGTQVFETPAGTVCPGRRNSKAVPALPPRFSYSAEVLDVEPKTKQFVKKAYDKQLKLAMLDFVSAQPPYSKLRVIDDFNTGASYTLDRVRGNCSLSTIDPVGFDAIKTGTGLRMRTPHEFFFDQETDYSYEGIRSIRQLNADVWVGQKWWPPNNPKNSTWEYYFITPEWQENAGVTTAHSMPVSIHIILGTIQQVHQIYNLYNFADSDPGIWEYDITSCFDDNQQYRGLSVQFNVTQAQLVAVSTNQRAFRLALLTSLTSLVPMSPVRVNNIQLEFRHEMIVVQLVIVEAVHPTSSGVTSPLRELPLVTLMTRLQEAIGRRQLMVNVTTDAGPVTLVASASPASVDQAGPPADAPSQEADARSQGDDAKTSQEDGAPNQDDATSRDADAPNQNDAPSKETDVLSGEDDAPSQEDDAAGRRGVVSPPPPPQAPALIGASGGGGGGGGGVVVCDPSDSGYTPGDVAGVTMGMTFAAYVTALLGVTVWSRYRGGSQAYSRERLEMS